MKERNYIFKKHYVKVKEQTVLWSVTNHHERNLIFFLKLKRHIQNGYIKNPKKRYKEFNCGLSRKTYIRRLDALTSLGWAIQSKEGISLIGIDKMPVQEVKQYNKYLYLENDNTLNYSYIRFLIHVISERVQKVKAKLHSENNQQRVIKTNNGNFVHQLIDLKKEVSLSIKVLSTKLNRSRSTALRQMKKIRKLGSIVTVPRYVFAPFATTAYIIINGEKFKRIANQFLTNFDRKIRNRIFLAKMDRAERIVRMYCNDCFD